MSITNNYMKELFIERVYSKFISLANLGKNLEDSTLQSIIREELKCSKGLFHKMPTKSDLLNIYLDANKNGKLEYNITFVNLLTTKLVRSSSGVLPISIALSGIAPDKQEMEIEDNTFSCAYNCSFCPNECVSNGAPKDIARSYLSNEGTFTRGALSDFDTIRQVWRRLAELESMGHLIDKLEIIPLGGTWGCYSKTYRYKFSNELFYACNTYKLFSIKLCGEYCYFLEDWLNKKPFLNNLPIPLELYNKITEEYPIKSLKEEKDINTKSKNCRIIGIVFETRPDKINKMTLTEKRILGCTRIQLGIQHTNNDVLALNNRGHTVETSIRAIKYCRDAGFKIDIHIMPDLPWTTLEKDYEMINRIFLGNELQPDYCKLYPCLDLPYTLARTWKEQGKWKPIAENNFREFLDFLCYTLSIIPPWVRINRVQRDFLEANEKNGYLGFVSDTIKTNLHQIVELEMKKKGLKCFDIRSREIKNNILSDSLIEKAKLYIRIYRANEGIEFFISVEIPKYSSEILSLEDNFDDTYLLGLCRLRFPDYELNQLNETNNFKEKNPNHYLSAFRNKLDKIARIRELHVYGNISSKNSQHKGIGKFLIYVAENISRNYGFNKSIIISGVGVRNYYERLGYYLEQSENEYMEKNLIGINDLELFNKKYSSKEIIRNIDNCEIIQKYIYKKQSFNMVLNRNYKIYSEDKEGFSITSCDNSNKKNNYKYFIYLFIIILVFMIAGYFLI